MPLHLYRRHNQDCRADHPADSRSGELDERRKGWKRCHCAIHVSGTLSGRFSRRATGNTSWDDARSYLRTLEAAGSWDRKTAAAPESNSAPVEKTERVTIGHAVTSFLANREALVSHPTYRKYRTFTSQLQAFADSLGYVMLDQFRPGNVDAFYVGSRLGPRSKAKMLDRLRAFFRFCVHREWLAKSPVSPDLRPPAGSTKAANKMPFSDEQLGDIIRSCDRMNDFASGKWGNRHGHGQWNGEDLKDFIWVMVYTGLRISDVVLFDIERLHGNDIFLRAKKNGGDVFTYIPDWLRDRLNARASRFGRRPFLIGGSKRLDTVIDTWRTRIAKVFEFADIGPGRATPHRFRHTFARMLLQRGVPVADVGDLLGDDERTVRDHYARWVPERQARLTKILKDALAER
jgi:integrase